MWPAFKFMLRTLVLTAVALCIGFVAFVAMLSREPPGSIGTADGIVALTGGKDRIAVAVGLLAAGKAKRLLISGVNPRTTQGDLIRVLPAARRLFVCCIDIGYDAQDTHGNANETRDWVRRAGFRRIIVVTSSYHMPRSLAELGRALPGVEFEPYPVVAGDIAIDEWWRDGQTARLLVVEYLKLLPVMVQVAVSRLTGYDVAALGSSLWSSWWTTSGARV
ncbi:MAG: YdcF family protein [Rhizobiales bacterium]|nr:YdcF family protein [Hyphomicrobiales bacterium]